MPSISLGRVGFVLRGTYSSSNEYNPLDVVYYNGSCYAAKVHMNAGSSVVPTQEAAWQCLVQVGSVIDNAMTAAAVRYDESQSLDAIEKDTARANIEAAKSAAIAPLFNPNTSYSAGNYVIYPGDGMLYKFSANHTGAWTGGVDAFYANITQRLNALITVDGTSLVID